jgi:hypothetical protein
MINSYFNNGYWFTYCDYLPHKPKLVEADIERLCPEFKEVEQWKPSALSAESRSMIPSS